MRAFTIHHGKDSVRVRRDHDGEYRCALYRAGVHKPGADYFCDDAADAVGTACAMLGIPAAPQDSPLARAAHRARMEELL